MKKLSFLFLFLFAGMFAIFGVLFLRVRPEALPARVRSFNLRKAIRTELDEPVE